MKTLSRLWKRLAAILVFIVVVLIAIVFYMVAMPGKSCSDHWSFWQEGYPAIMVTDTAPFRNPNYHQPTDRSDTLNYERMARVVHGLVGVVVDLGK